MFGKDRERKRVDAQFAELTEQLSDVDAAGERELAHVNENSLLLHQARGPRDYTPAVDPDADHYSPPQPRHVHLRGRVWMTIIAALVMVCLPVCVAIVVGKGTWWFWISEAAATLIFIIGLFISLRSSR